jgi:competence transcription factor ComK
MGGLFLIMNILYYIEAETETIEVSEFQENKYNSPIKKIFENLCLSELTTLKGRIDAIKKVYNYGYNVPIYINSNLILFKIKDHRTLWINYFKVGSIIKKKNGADIVFKNGTVLNTSVSYRSLLNSFSKAQRIIQE